MRKSKLRCHEADYTSIFPFRLVVYYRPNSTSDQILLKAQESNPALQAIPLDSFPSAAFVSQIDTTIYLFITDQLTLDILVHECIHITKALFFIMNSEFNTHTEELFAYINQFMFRQLLNILKEHLKFHIKL